MRKSKLKTRARVIRAVGGASIGAMVLLLVVMLCPVGVNGDAQAEEMNAYVSTDTTAYIKSVISVALSSQVDIEVTPKSTGAFAYNTATLKVATNNTSGYAVYLQTQDDSQQLKALNPANTWTINAVSGKMTANDFAENVNTWGYANTTAVSPEVAEYVAVPKSTGAAILQTNVTSSDDTYDLSFGVAVGTDLPAGGYTNKVLVSAVANPVEITNMMQLTHMQDMTPEICAGTAQGATKQLIDARDGKAYWVAKMKDGKCWMVQNLDLDLNDTTLPLKAGTTDLVGKTEWTPDTQTGTGNANFTTDRSETISQSYDPGMWVLTDPQMLSDCGVIGSGKKSPAECGNIYTNVEGWEPTYSANGGTAINSSNKTYDAHYLIGNYYSWPTAVVGEGVGLKAANVDGSICPKGWKLSTGGMMNSARAYGNSDYVKLLRAEGYTQEYFIPEDDTTQRGMNVADAMPPVTAAPLYLLRAGYVRMQEFLKGGNYGYIWQGTTSLTATGIAMHVGLFMDYLYPDYTYLASRDLGMNVRCLAR